MQDARPRITIPESRIIAFLMSVLPPPERPPSKMIKR